MTSKLLKKSMSVILVVAICVSTLCSSMIAASAATADNTYSIVTDSVAAGTKKTTVTVTLTSEAGLTSGTFDLMFGKDVIDDVNFDANGNYVTPTNETVDEFRLRDKDGNFMINGTNVYKTVDVYDEDGNKIGTQEVVDYVIKENVGNKGVLLPNVYDGSIGLYDTKIEITDGTRADGTAFNISDFTNSNYTTFAKGEGNTANAIEGSNDDGRKFIYNMTDGYKATHYNSNPTTYLEIQDGETTKTVMKQDVNLLDKYYREYTTVDVATENLGYSISTVSEDSVASTHAYTQYAQGFKDISFNSSVAYKSITFTVTLDFTGISDRVSANAGVDADELTGTTTVDGAEANYRNSDGHWATENYVQNGTKYALNFVSDDAALNGLSAASENSATNFFHVHKGTITEETGLADPVNKEAIESLLAKNPSAREGVDYFELYNARCDICSRVTPMIAAPDLRYTVKDENENWVTAKGTKGQYAFNNFRNLSGVNLTYENDGSISLNLHYPSSMDGEQMLITDENGMVLSYSDTIEVSSDTTQKYTSNTSSFAGQKITIDEKTVNRYEGELLSTAKMITVSGFSAADIDKTLYVARYTPKSSTENQLMGITHMVSITDCLNDIVTGEEYEDGDKLVAASLINYANAATTALGTQKEENGKIIPTEIDLLEFGDYLTQAGSSSKYWDTNVADNGETGASWDDPIIIDSAEEFVYIAKVGNSDTDGKYFKVADNILGFNLATDKLDINGTLEDNLNAIMGSGKNHSGNTPGFQGHFDGNGVTVYGAWGSNTSVSAYSGLFTATQGDVTIKNVNVKLASFTAKNAAGGIVGYYKGEGTYTTNTTLTIENCSVTDSHLEITGTGYGCAVGAIVGRVDCPSSYVDTNDEDGDSNTTEKLYVNNKINVNNCYINLDENYFTSPAEDGTEASGERACHGGVAGVLGTNALKVSNCVVIGITPYATSECTTQNDVQHSGLETHFTNVYTDQTSGSAISIGGKSLGNRNFTGKVYQLTTEQLTGADAADNMTTLNWDTVWCVNEGGYPSIYAPYNIPEIEPQTIYWNGNIATSLSSSAKGTKDDPIIIYTAEELAYIVGQKDATITKGKYFKLADTIANIVLQPESKAADIMALDSAAAVKTYFENGSGFKAWKNYGWEGSTFCGNIDFNGVTIYGAYIKDSASNAALISNVDAGAAIQNLTLTNSYMTSAATNYQVAAIAAVSNSKTYGGVYSDGIVWINKVTVANNYLYNTSTQINRSGVLVGSFSDSVYIDNVLVYGNDATYGDDVKMPLINAAGNSVPSTVAVPDGLVTKLDYDKNAGVYYHFNMVRNSIILGCDPYDVTQGAGSRFNDVRAYENVYTDAETTNVQFTNEKKNFTPAQLTRITADEIKGLDARSAMPLLDWHNALTNPDGAWYCSYLSAMPSLTPLDESISAIYPGYSAIVFDTPDATDYYENHANGTMSFGVYQTALSLKANPYMSFAFAFHGDYQTNRDKIQITFTYTVDGAEYTTDPISPPACTYTDGDVKGRPDNIVNVNGWTNTKSNGRYHTYKATGIPVTAMESGITIKASYNNGEWKNLGTFSVDGVGLGLEAANSVEPSEYYESRIEAAKALKFYIYALQTRYGA